VAGCQEMAMQNRGAKKKSAFGRQIFCRMRERHNGHSEMYRRKTDRWALERVNEKLAGWTRDKNEVKSEL
jgi:hypothetical protein